MAVSEKVLQRSLNLNVVTSMDDNGDVKVKARSYTNVNPTATAEQIHAAGEALSGLMTEDVQSICYTEKKELTNLSA